MLLSPLHLPSWPGPRVLQSSPLTNTTQLSFSHLSRLASPPAPGAPYLSLPRAWGLTLSPGPPISDPELARSPLKLLHPPWASLVLFTGQGSTAATVREGCGLGSSVPVVIPEKLVLTSVCHETEAEPCEQPSLPVLKSLRLKTSRKSHFPSGFYFKFCGVLIS